MTYDLKLSLLATEASAGLARTLASARLTAWRLPHLIPDATLVIAELVANAAAETPHQLIQLHLTNSPEGVTVAVWDASPRMPAATPPPVLTLDTLDLSEQNFDANGGWGLSLVAALAADHGTSPTDPGKWIWARLKP